MKASGRRSAADLAASRLRSKAIEPTRKLLVAEKKVWDRFVAAWPSDQFISSDAELLTQYCSVVCIFDIARKSGNFALMERMARLVLSYATKLRATPQSRYGNRQAGRAADRGASNEVANLRLIGGTACHKD